MHHLKILVIGPQGAGKTTMIQRVARDSISTDVQGTTVGLDFGLLQTSGLIVHLFGSPGLQHFNLVRKALSNGSDGVILVVDSTNPHSVKEAEQYLCELFPNQIPPVFVAANKQDLKGALTPSQIQRLLSQPIPVFPTIALEGLGLEELLLTFIQHLISIGKGRDIEALLHNA